MIDFGTWKVAAAREYCERYSQAAPGRAAWLAGEYRATGGAPELVGTSDDLDPLWRWLRERISAEGANAVELKTDLPADDPHLGNRPPWHDPHTQNPYLSDGLMWIVEGMGCYLAELAAHVSPGAEWRVYRAPNRRDFNQNRTMLFDVVGAPVDPSRMVYTAVIGPVIHNDQWDGGALSNLYRYMVDPAWKAE